MNKKFMIAGAAVLVAGGLAILALNFYWLRPAESAAPTARQMEERAARLGLAMPPSAPPPVRAAPPIDPKKPVRLAIGWLGLPDESQNGQAGDLLLAALSPVKNLQLVDRQSLDKVLRESQMSLSGLVRAESATRLGKLLRADWFLLGSAATVNGGNYLVIRIVDARTGAMLNAEIFPRQDGPAQLVSKISAFVRQSRESASHPGKPRVFLAIGSFKDESVNDRQADFPAKLRGYLTAAYHGNTNVTLLEREFVDLLHQEMQLDLAGLTGEGLTNGVQPMQAAFWLVDGYYQSYETSGFEVEIALRVHRMFGLSVTAVLRGPPEEPFYRQIKSRIELAITQQAELLLAPTHHGEIEAQLELGRELSPRRFDPFLPSKTWGMDRDYKRTLGNLEEAIRAYQAVLILDPGNREAKMGLAACWQHVLIGKEPEARGLVQEVAESSIDDKWKYLAMEYLIQYFRSENRTQAAEWHKRATEFAKTHPAICNQFGLIGFDLTAKNEAGPDSIPPDPESILVENTRQMLNEGKSRLGFGMVLGPGGRPAGTISGLSALSEAPLEMFLDRLGTNRTEAVERLNKFLPTLREKCPELAPDLTAMALPFQLDTNSPVVAEFAQSFDACAAHPEKLLDKANYFWRASRNCYNWCMDKKLYTLAARIIEVKRRVQMTKGGIEAGFAFFAPPGGAVGAIVRDPAPIELEDKTRLVYAYMGLERWQEALDLIGTLPRQPYALVAPGPWGQSVATAELIIQCRDKLGLPTEKDSKVFALAAPWRIIPKEPIHIPIAFTADQDSFWLGIYGRLWKISLNLEFTNEVQLGNYQNSEITAFWDEPSKLWIGTRGDGLIEYDKQSHESRRFTEKDGLLINNISVLCRQGDVMWIGYGGYSGDGGFGRLDLRTGRATSFTSTLRPHYTRDNDPPRDAVLGVAAGRPEELFVRVGVTGLNDHPPFLHYRIREDVWEGWPWVPVTFTADSGRLILGMCETPNTDKSLKGVGIIVQTFADGTLDKIGLSSGLPNTEVQTVALDGNDLWIGGTGFIGVMDLPQKTMRKFFYTHTQKVDGMVIGGGYVWVLMDWSLYRIPLSETR